ncbi:entry exclusion lipoprotein TrbK [Glaesserella sp.]|uniref:entry exclusion lipoprotein TrbK n=1 Tax=Glaesserella sp. TaxID=2094731 RepID=UPI00359F5D83
MKKQFYYGLFALMAFLLAACDKPSEQVSTSPQQSATNDQVENLGQLSIVGKQEYIKSFQQNCLRSALESLPEAQRASLTPKIQKYCDCGANNTLEVIPATELANLLRGHISPELQALLKPVLAECAKAAK